MTRPIHFLPMRLLAASAILLAALALAPVVIAQTPAETVSFTSDDGIALSGLWYGKGDEVVILSHQYDLDQSAWADLAGKLADAGYGVLTYNFRGYPPSAGARDIGAIGHDLEAAIALARAQGANKIVLVGASMGGIATVPAAVTAAPDAYVILSAPLGFAGLIADDASLAASPAAKLFINTDADTYIADTRHMIEVAAEPKDSEIYAGGEHGLSMFAGPHGAEVGDRIIAFIKQAMPVSQ